MSGALVGFSATRSEGEYCQCDACHDTSFVTKIRYPVTMFHDGKTLTTKYKEMWLCDFCLEKLKKVICEVSE